MPRCCLNFQSMRTQAESTYRTTLISPRINIFFDPAGYCGKLKNLFNFGVRDVREGVKIYIL
jgi:hypothetical protein